MGLHKLIKKPEHLWRLFVDYKKDLKDNPILRKDFKGKDANVVNYELERPLTMEGFEDYVAEIPDHPQTLDHYFSNREERYSDFVAVCSRVRRSIRRDQIEGGMSGIYNPSITQRLNGLVDKQEVKTEKIKPIKLVNANDEPEDA